MALKKVNMVMISWKCTLTQMMIDHYEYLWIYIQDKNVKDIYKYMYNKTAILICLVLKRKRKSALSDYNRNSIKLFRMDK